MDLGALQLGCGKKSPASFLKNRYYASEKISNSVVNQFFEILYKCILYRESPDKQFLKFKADNKDGNEHIVGTNTMYY